MPFRHAAPISRPVLNLPGAWVSHLRGKIARLVAVLALVAGLIGAALPTTAGAMPTTPAETQHMAMDCDHQKQPQAPAQHHLPGTDNCCIANVCAMSVALPVLPSSVALPAFAGRSDYARPVLLQPAGITAAPIPHPPKSNA